MKQQNAGFPVRRRSGEGAIVKTLALFLLLAAPVFGAAPELLPIATARSRMETTVTVIGLVTVRPAVFMSFSGDAGFAIQDQTGGIWVNVQQAPKLREGQKVRVTGRVNQSNGKVQITPTSASDVVALPGTDLHVATGQVKTPVMGFIISVEGTIESLEPDPPDGWKLYVNDGTGRIDVYIATSSGINVNAPYLKPGRRVRATGFASVYGDKFEVDVRRQRDLKALR